MVVVLFADLAGYTALCERLDPEDVHLQVRPLMTQLRRIAEELGAVVPSVAGDGFMAAFGAGSAHEDDPVRAVVAAARMQRHAGDVRRRSRGRWTVPALRVGLNVGEAFVAPSYEAGGVSVTGDTVNVGSRLCGLADDDAVLASATVAMLTPGIDGWEPTVREAAVRNRREPIRTRGLRWEAVSLQPATASRRVRHTGPIVDRSEMQLALLARVAAGQPGAVVLGEPGVGKTRLLDEVERRLSRPALRLTCRAHAESPVDDAAAALRHLLALGPDEVADRVEGAIGAGLPALPALLGRRVRRLLGAAGRTYEADSDAELVEAFAALCDVLAPVVLVVDDLHDATPAVRRWLATLVGRPGVTVLAASREPLPGFGPLARVQLEPLAAADVETLIERRLPGCPAEVVALLQDRSGGLPLVVEECADLLLEEGTVVASGGRLRVARPDRLSAVPTSMSLFVTARLDRLPPAIRAAADVAACFPGGLARELLSAVLGRDSRPALGELTARGLMAESGRSVGFRHGVVREVAAASVSREFRLAVHARAAAWLSESLDPESEDLEEFVTQAEAAVGLAERSGGAGCALVALAVRAWVMSASALIERAPRVAAARVATAAEWVARRPECPGLDVFALRVAQARVLHQAGAESGALDALRAALRDGGELTPRQLVVGRLLEGQILSDLGDPAAVDVLRDAATRAAAAGLPVREAEALLHLAVCDFGEAGSAPVLAALETAYAVAHDSGNASAATYAAVEMARHQVFVGVAAWSAWQDRAEREITDQDVAGAAVLAYLRVLHTLLADPGARGTAAPAEQAAEAAAASGAVQALLFAEFHRYEAAVQRCDLARADQLLPGLLALADDRPSRRIAVQVLANAVLHHQRSGRSEQAAEALASASADAAPLGASYRSEALRCGGTAAVERGAWEQGCAAAGAAADIDLRQGHLLYALRPRLAVLRGQVAGRAAVTDGLRADAAAQQAWSTDALAARWLLQDRLLRGEGPGRRVPDQPDLAEARALDAENAALGAVAAGQERLALAMFAVAQGHWAALGCTVWRARAGIWASEVAGDEGLATDARRVLRVLDSPRGLEAELRAQVRALRR